MDEKTPRRGVGRKKGGVGTKPDRVFLTKRHGDATPSSRMKPAGLLSAAQAARGRAVFRRPSLLPENKEAKRRREDMAASWGPPQILAAAIFALIYLARIESRGRNNRYKRRARLRAAIRRVLAHFADQAFSARRRCAHDPGAGETPCALSGCPN